tara:strand:- start:392 stop:736 length:345 start_codon:yes stop_codon:yes gene_type:complete
MKSWTCIENCGACCKFDLNNRKDIFHILNEDDINLIISMTDKDGWCKFLDKKNKKCSIYKERPHFCRVEKFSKNFDEYLQKGDKFLIQCCKQHIGSIYGKRSKQMIVFKSNTNK